MSSVPRPARLPASMIRSLSSRIRCSAASTPGSAAFALAVAGGVRVRAPAGFAARAVDFVVRDPAAVRRFCCPAVAFLGCGITASLCCALAIFETDGRDPTSWVETRDSKLAATRATRSYGACVQLDRSLSVEHRHGGVHSSGDGVGGHRWGQPLHDHRQLDQAVCPTSTRPYLFVLLAASHDA